MKNFSVSLLHTAWTEEEKKQLDESIEFVENYNGTGYIADACLYLYNLLRVDYILVTVVDLEPVPMVNSLVFLQKGIIAKNISYPLLGSPCEGVYGKEQNYYPGGVQDLFPKNDLLVAMQVKSYLGVPIFDKHENGLGCIALLHSNIIGRGGFVEALINVMLPRLEEELNKACSSTQSRESFLQIMAEMAH